MPKTIPVELSSLNFIDETCITNLSLKTSHWNVILIVTPCLLPRVAKRGIAMLIVDEFPYPQKQTRSNEFIPLSHDFCHTLKHLKIQAIPLIWPKSSNKHSVTRSHCSAKENARQSESPLWRHQWCSVLFIFHVDDVKREMRLYIARLVTNQNLESATSMGYIYIYYIYIYTCLFVSLRSHFWHFLPSPTLSGLC